ncbi:proto-oncogene tyrosine-protein kinase ROS-like [Babylonia areolata]|uniref:proto-oncogene tyrosine-protein kinase ROS-like n=1 Tax=Babylonia areolata TaxID=304850 RepID=UPI003FCF566E
MQPTAISVDWLADRVYVASLNRLYSCPLEVDRCFVAVGNLDSTPTDVKVDPVNGYLYYALNGTDKGLYRIDLDTIRPTATPRPQQIVTMDDLSAFAVDFDNVQLYFPNSTQDTIMACFLDGSDIKDFRQKVVKRAYRGITSMTYANQVFYWTDGFTAWREEYDIGFSQYRHNTLLLFDPPFSGFELYHPKAQPTPVPLTAPTDVEALFTPNRAQIRWKPPQRLQYQGRGSWSRWMYEMELKDLKSDGGSGLHIETDTDTLNHTVDGLRPNTTYHIRVRAKSTAGVGPWSTFFVGTTLQQEVIPVRVLMGIPGMIIEKDLSKLTQTTVVSFFSEPVDISWHGDLLLWTTNHGDLYVYNRFNNSKSVLQNAKNAYCVAYDWLGNKIFWSEPKLGVIRRSDPRGIHPEFIYQAEARDLAVDSMAGRLYWATTNSINSAYLNGENPVEIFSVAFFSGLHVISLTLNFDLGKVMWYVKGYDSQELWMASLIGQDGKSALEIKQTVRLAASFHSISQTSGLQYYSHRLFWVDSVNALVVGDMECNYTSVVAPTYNNVTSFAVAHPSMQHFPEDVSEEEVLVIPQKINQTNIRTVGDWSNFNLTWDRDPDVNHGTVFFKLFLQIGKKQIHKTTSQPWFNIRGRSPYTLLVVSLQPYTYWGYAEATTLSIRSPMSIPQEPMTPRVYVTQHKNASTAHISRAADFRWSTPHVTNGVLSHHFITYWRKDQAGRKETIQVSGTARHFILTPLATSQTYSFEVVACTEAGCGPPSSTVSAVTDAVNPVPMLLIATSAGVNVSEFDNNLTSATVLLNQVSPSALAYLAQDNRTFWIERNDALFVSQNSEQKTELVEMSGQGKDLNLDWISRTLYVVERTEGPSASSTIMGYHMDQDIYTRVIVSQNTIGSVISDPYASMLLWTEVDRFGQGSLMSATMGTSEQKAILGKHIIGDGLRKKRAIYPVCPCMDSMNVSPVIAMDYYTKHGQNEVVFVDVRSNTIFTVDINGCNCSVIFKPSQGEVHGLPPSLLAVDHLRVYWYNSSEGQLYSINKITRDKVQKQNLTGVQDIVAYGRHLQPLPDSECLDPGPYKGSVETSQLGNTSVLLRLQPVQRPSQCGRISAPQDKFTVYFRRLDVDKTSGFLDCSSSPDDCLKKEAYSTGVELQGLEPFTQYLVQVAVSNYYTEYLSEALSDPHRFTTKPGVPQAARDIRVMPLTPEEMKVTWQPPQKVNGPGREVTYRVLFSTMVNSVHIKRETDNLMLNKTRDGSIYTVLKGLEPSHVYDVEVETCMMGRDMCNRSVKVKSQTFDTPGDIVLVNATHNSLMLRWQSPADNSILRHNYEYAKIQEGQEQLKWKQREEIPSITKNFTTYVESFRNLDPHTRYAVRVKASYRTPPYHMYFWPADPKENIFQTLTWKPEQTPAPEIRHLKSGAYEVEWDEPEDNGAEIIAYSLVYSALNDDHWSVAYNGSESRWLVDETMTKPGMQYVFRVAAYNAKGWGPFSVNSSTFLSPPAVDNDLHHDITIGIAVALCAIVLVTLIAISFICLWRRKQQEKKKKQQFLNMVRGPDTELATLRELPHSTFQQSNTLYGLTIIPTDEEVASLPHVCRDQLDLTQFLGSGAFGEVYEGVARHIRAEAAAPVKCAIKTLRKSASDHEKEEFLKEAILMKNFQHEHILGLLGVCLDNDPHFIIMELMEGGDLLSFLRSSRATSTTPAKLQLPDLVKICVHVAKGCKYLEDMHFVHRDLAARNCLVSSPDVDSMVVKIGDFGLARDIYKHDYYRKEGEGLLPVRWMSPESLVDGVFTTQSDIWAFGVLMWEVVTLGQQPYPARTNIEVLHFVRAGGKLERPEKCTDDMFSLMQKCWSFGAEERPCFAYLLQELVNYEEKCAQMSPAEIALHSPTGADARTGSLYAPQYAGSTSEGSSCSSSSSVTSSTQVQVYTAPSPSSCRPQRRGGSVRMTPASKKKRLMTLLGGADSKEKMMVDLPGMGRSRTSSLDSKRSSLSESSRTPYSMSQFPPVREYDAMGYLEPRQRRLPQYLQLLNHAPELELPAFKNARAEGAEAAGDSSSTRSQHASAFRPVGPYSRAAQLGASGGGGKSVATCPPSVLYSSVTAHNSHQPGPFSSNHCERGRGSSSSSSQTYGVVSVQDPQCCDGGVAERLVVDLTDLSRIKASQRKFSDQDLYSSPAQFNQRAPRLSSTSSSLSEHPYSRVMDSHNNNNHNSNNNNYSFASTSSARTTPVANGGDRLFSGYDLNQSYCSSRGKAPPPRWTNRSGSESDSVFEQEEELRLPPPPYVNVQNGPRSRGQMYPENGGPLAGYDIAQASLV